MVQTFPESKDDIPNFSVPDQPTRPSPVPVNPPKKRLELKAPEMKKQHEPQADLSIPWWLYVIGLYEIVTLVWNSVNASFLYSDGQSYIHPSEIRPAEENAVLAAFIICAITFTVSVILLLGTTVLMVSTLTMRNEKSKQSCLKYWTYASYGLLAVDCIGIVCMFKTLLVDGSIMQKTEVEQDNTKLIIAVTLTLLDLFARGISIYTSGSFLTSLTIKLMPSEDDFA